MFRRHLSFRTSKSKGRSSLCGKTRLLRQPGTCAATKPSPEAHQRLGPMGLPVEDCGDEARLPLRVLGEPSTASHAASLDFDLQIGRSDTARWPADPEVAATPEVILAIVLQLERDGLPH